MWRRHRLRGASLFSVQGKKAKGVAKKLIQRTFNSSHYRCLNTRGYALLSFLALHCASEPLKQHHLHVLPHRVCIYAAEKLRMVVWHNSNAPNNARDAKH